MLLETRRILAMDSDTEDRLLQNGDVRKIVNMHVASSDEDNVGAAENLKGNQLAQYALPSGTNKCIGAKYDKKTNKVYYWVYNSLGDHLILRYNHDTKTITKVLQSSLLNLNPSYLIVHANIIEGLLYWTDDINPPRKINIDKAIKNLYPSPFTEEYMEAIKYPPLYPAAVVYGSDPSKKTNNLKGYLWQFKYQYIYDDNDRSSFGPISKLPLPSGEEFLDPLSPSDPTINNVIKVKIKKPSDIATKIRVAAREGNLGDFFEVTTLNISDITFDSNDEYELSFYNDRVYLPIDIQESIKLYDFIPQLAKCQDIIDNNRLVYFNILEGYDNVEINVELEQKLESIGQPKTSGIIESTDDPNSFTAYFITILESKLGYHYRINFDYSDPNTNIITNYTFSYTSNASDTIDSVKTAFINMITARLPGSIVQTSTPGQFLLVTHISGPLPTVSGNSQSPTRRTFKSGTAHSFGIVYYDYANRSGNVNKSNKSEIYIESFPERTDRLGSNYGRSVASIDFKINHKPPDWATHYQIVYSGNVNMTRFLQFNIGDINVNADNGQLIDLILTPLVNYNTKYYKNSILSYDWAKGDRIRFISGTNGSFLATLVDEEIIAYDSGTAKITIKEMRNILANNPVDANTPFGDGGVLAEIYTPRKSSDSLIYYEIGERYDILDPGSALRRHKGQTQDQNASATLPAIIRLTDGDVYYKSRNMEAGTPTPSLRASLVEDFNYSDFYASNFWDKGRPNAEDPNAARTRRPTTGYFTDPFVEETTINGLSTVYDTSFKSYNREYGSVQKIFAEDHRLTLFQELKVGQIPIEERILYDNSGQSVVATTTEVFNPIVYFKGDYGIGKNPESFAEYGGVKYFVDVRRLAVLRISNDGLTPISSYQFNNWTSDKFASILNYGKAVNIYGVFDKDFDEYIISIEQSGQPGGSLPEDVEIDSSDIEFDVEFIRQIGNGIYDIIATVTKNPKGYNVEFSATRNVNNGTYTVTAVYVPVFFPETNVVSPDTVAFNERLNRWTSFYTFYPEFMCESEETILTWSSGRLFVHNTNPYHNSFYGFLYDSEIHIIFNAEFDKKKIAEAITENSTEVFEAYEITNQVGQSTSLIESDFDNKEDKFHLAFW